MMAKNFRFLLLVSFLVIVSAVFPPGSIAQTDSSSGTGEKIIDVTRPGIQPSIRPSRPSRIRAFHIPLGGATYKRDILALIDRLEGRFNMLIIQVNNKLKYDRHPEISSSEGASLDRTVQGAPPMSKKDLMEIVEYGRKKGFEMVPEVKFLTHQEKFFRRSHPDLMYNEVTYDPGKPEVYEIAYAVIDEVSEVFQPKYFHIGHDEMREHMDERPDERSKIPSYRDFAAHANKLAAYVKKKGMTPMMWGDMLLNPDDFRASDKKFLHAVQGYEKAVDLLDKDIIIIDWQYRWKERSFPTFDYFLSKGFRVMGATFANRDTTMNFGAYVCGKDDPKALGMVSTVWAHFLRKEANEIDMIIEDSARAFSGCR